jgi:predicted MFS family arabinose efflux permease
VPIRSVTQSLRRLRQTLREALPYRDFTQLLACAVAYQGGVAVAITLAAIYAEQVIGFQPQETMVLIFVLNIAAFVGALIFGHVQDRLGHKLALSLTLAGLGGHLFHRGAVHRQGHVLVGGRDCWLLHGIEPVCGSRHGGADGAGPSLG